MKLLILILTFDMCFHIETFLTINIVILEIDYAYDNAKSLILLNSNLNK